MGSHVQAYRVKSRRAWERVDLQWQQGVRGLGLGANDAGRGARDEEGAGARRRSATLAEKALPLHPFICFAGET